MIPSAELEHGIPFFALFVRTGLASSNGEARRLIQGGGGKLNDQTLSDETRLISTSDLRGDVIKLTAGKKRHILVKPAP